MANIKEFQQFAAKSGPKGRDLWLPLWMHAMDTAGILEYLVKDWLPEKVQRQLGCDGYITEFARFLGFTHDIGKLTFDFQMKLCKTVFWLMDRLLDEGFLLNGRIQANIPHGVLGEAILREYFEAVPSVACVIGGHHGKPACEEDPEDYWSYFKANFWGPKADKQKWKSAWNAYLDWVLETCGYPDIKGLPVLSIEQQVLWTGLLIVADWLASNAHYFPLIHQGDARDLGMYPKRVDEAWKNIGFSRPWEPYGSGVMDEIIFYEQFGFYPNEVQKAMYEAMMDAYGPGLFILEAPMGCGKTEAALSGVQVLAGRGEIGGLYFGLPTQATTDGMFGRLEGWVKDQAWQEPHSFQLLHGRASFNKEYQSIEKTVIREEDEDGIVVHPWMTGRKQALLSDFVISTIDHLLMAVLPQRHFMLRHLGIAGKVVVVDECHCYDAYMREILKNLLAWLGQYQVPVILLSATLPCKYRQAFVEAYLRGKCNGGTWAKTTGYPLLTYTADGKVYQKVIPLDDSWRQEIWVQKGLREERLTDILRNKLSGGGCAAVIVNTVQHAQRLGRMLKEACPDKTVIVSHASFPMAERARIEAEILRRTGKPSTKEVRDGVILVGTQVLEQSLDYDVDFMVCELCPMDLLLQRMGRLHRHHRDYRPEKVKKAEFAVLEPTAGTPFVYAPWLLSQTREKLPDRVQLPDDISGLVQTVYEVEGESDEYRKYLDDCRRKKQKADRNCIHLPQNADTIHGLLDNGEIYTAGNDRDADAYASMCVRDSGPSIQVIIVRQDGDGYLRSVSMDNRFDRMRTPNDDEAGMLLGCQMPLPGRFVRGYLYQKTVAHLEEMTRNFCQEWRKSVWLEDALFLVLDEQGYGELSGQKIRYTAGFGLEIITQENVT